MNTPRSNPDSDWENLVRQARKDSAPSVNVTALLRTVRQAQADSPRGWIADFLTLFSPARVVPVCVIAASAVVLVTTWQAMDCWEALTWTQLFSTAQIGGTP